MNGLSENAVACSFASGQPCDGSAAASGTSACESGATGSDEPREPCPTPLAWQEVLRAFRAESQSWKFERDGGLLQGRSWGEGPPVYFLNGLGGTHELFALTVWLMRERFRCVVFDYREPAAAGGKRQEFSVDDLADDLLAIADFHGDRRFHVFATSLGVPVALSAMLKQPERIERAVFQAGFVRLRWSLLERLLIGLSSWCPMSLRRIPLWAQIQQQNHRPWFPPFDLTRWEFFVANTGGVPASAVGARARAIADCDLRPMLGQIERPILILRGEGEGETVAQRTSELEGLADVRIEDMHTTGCVTYLTHPHRLAKRISSFYLGEDEPVPSSVAANH